MNILRTVAAFFLACGAPVILGGCSEQNPSTTSAENTPARKETLRVLATFAPIYSFTKNVAGNAAEVEMLLPPDTGPHDFSLSPGDLRKLANSDVVVQNGFGLEDWLDRAIKGALREGAVRIVASKGIEPLRNRPADLDLDAGEAKPHAHAHEGEGEEGHKENHQDKPGHAGAHKHEEDAGGPNPHVWLDPILAIKQVENIRDGLTARDPANAEAYIANANAFITRLRNLDDEIGRATVALPNKRLLTFHDFFGYFAARYGFEIAGVVEPFPGREPTPRYIRHLRDLITSRNVRALFSEPQFSPQILRSLSDDLKVPVAPLDPMETGEASADFYERTMRQNVKTIADALK